MIEAKEQAAQRMYPGVTFDMALPQDWVDMMIDKHDADVRPHFVWGYENSMMGCPLPVTAEGAQMMYRAYNDHACTLRRLA